MKQTIDGHTNYPVCGCAIQHCRRRPQQGQRCPSAQAGALLALFLILVIQFGSGQCRVLGWMGDLSGTQQFNNCSNWNVTGSSDCTPKENDTFIVPNSPDKAFTIEWFIDGDITLANLAFGRSDRVDKSTLLFIFNAKTTATLHVTNLLEIHSKTWTFRYGANTTSSSNTINVIAKDLKWSGRLLRSQLFTAFPTVLVTRQMTAFNGRREATHTKVLTSVVLSIAGNASWHGTSVQSVDGTIRVLPGALLHSFVPNWMQSGSDDGYDLIVDGTARLACATSCMLQTYIAVAGQLEFIPAVLSSDQDASLPTWTLLSGGLHAAGSVVFYFTNINVMPSKLQLLFGSWRVFGPPVVNSTYSFSSSTTTRWWEDITDPATQTIEYNFQQPVLITIAVHSSFWNLTIDAFTSRGPAQWRIMPMPSGVTTVDVKTALDMDEHGVLRLISAPVQFTTSFTVHSQLISSLGYVFVGDNWHMMLSGDHNTDIKRQVAVGRGALLEVPASIDGLIPVVDFQSQLYLKSRLVIAGANLQVKDLFVDSTALGDGIVLRTTASLIVSHQLTWKGGTIEGQGSTVKLRQGAVLTTNHTKSLLNATVTLEIDGSSAARRGGCIIEYFQYRHLLPTAVLSPPAMIQGFYNKTSLGTGTYRLPEAFDDPTTLADYSTLETSCSHNSEHYGRAPVLFSSAGIASSTDHLSFTENYAVRHTTRFFSHVAGDYVFTFAWSYSIVRFWFDGHVLVTFCGDGSQTSDGCNTDVRANISGTVTVPNLSKRQHEIRLDLIRLPPKPSTNQSFVVNYKFEVSAHVSGSTAQLGATNTLWGCQASGVSVIRFYPQTSFRIRFPENVCQTRSTPADLCSIKLGVACMRLSNTSLTLGKNSSIVVRRTGVLWLQNSSSIQEQVANTGSSIQRYGLIVNDAGGSLLQLAVSAHAHSCTSASALSVLPSMVSSDTTVQQGSCRFGAYEHMGRCYYPEVTSGPSPGAYQAGVGACACRGGFLASITSNSTAVFVNKMLQLTRTMIKGTPASATFYVGLKEPGCSSSNMLHAYTQTEWDDGSCPEQLPLPLQPSPRTPVCQPCFVLEKNYTSSVDGSSRLVQRSCTETSHRFICIEPPYSDVEPLAVKTCTNLSCSTGWTKYNSHCYRTRPAGVPALTHDDAAAQCFTTGAELISINDFAEQQILTPLIKADSFRVTFYWMGLYESGGNFRWRDGSAAVFRSWQCSDSNKNDIVNTALGQVAVDDKSIADSWFQVLTSDSSSRTGSYICEMRPPRQDASFWPPQLQQGGCRAEWFEYKQICYLFNASVARNWDGAKTECSAHGQNASLVEIYDVSILTVLQNHIMTSPPVGLPPGQCEWWIGLRRVNFKFQWLSGAPTSYLPWACGDDQSSKNCVHMRTCTTRSAFNNGWVTGTCSLLRPYICQYQMGAVSHATSPTVSTATEMASPHTNPATATSMSSQLVPSSVQPTAQATTSSATTGPSSTSESASQSTSVSTSTQQPTSQTSLPATTPIAQTLPITTPSAPQTTLTAAQPISQTPLSGTQATPQAPSSTPQPTPGTQPVSQTALSAAQTNVSTPPASTTEKEPNGTGQQLTTQSSLITTPGTAQGTVTTLAGTSSATPAAVPPVTSKTSLPITSANTTDVGTATAALSTGMTTNTQTQPTNTMQSTTKATGTVNQLTVTMATNTQQTPSSSSSLPSPASVTSIESATQSTRSTTLPPTAHVATTADTQQVTSSQSVPASATTETPAQSSTLGTVQQGTTGTQQASSLASSSPESSTLVVPATTSAPITSQAQPTTLPMVQVGTVTPSQQPVSSQEQSMAQQTTATARSSTSSLSEASTTVTSSEGVASSSLNLAIVVPSIAAGCLLMLIIIILLVRLKCRHRSKSLDIHTDTNPSVVVNNKAFGMEGDLARPSPSDTRTYTYEGHSQDHGATNQYAVSDGNQVAEDYTHDGDDYRRIDSSTRLNQDYQPLSLKANSAAKRNGASGDVYQPLSVSQQREQEYQQLSAGGVYAVQDTGYGRINSSTGVSESDYQPPIPSQVPPVTSKQQQRGGGYQPVQRTTASDYQPLSGHHAGQPKRDHYQPVLHSQQQAEHTDYQRPNAPPSASNTKHATGHGQQRPGTWKESTAGSDYYDSTLMT